MQVDWRELLFDLRRLGLGASRICSLLKGAVDERTLRMYGEGALAPSHYRGELLVALWIEHTGRPREALPVCPFVKRAR